MKISNDGSILKELKKRRVPVKEALSIFDCRKLFKLYKTKKVVFFDEIKGEYYA